MKFVDLFAGCGGLSRGFTDAGFELALAVEKSEMAAETYYNNFIGQTPAGWETLARSSVRAQARQKLVVGGVEEIVKSLAQGKLRSEDVSVLMGGPPCQGYSTAGKRDPDDKRNKLPDQFLKFIDMLEPKFVVVENVAGIISTQNRGKLTSSFANLASKISDKSYVVQPVQLDAAAYGVPQKRHRLFLICVRHDVARRAGLLMSIGPRELFRVVTNGGTLLCTAPSNHGLVDYEPRLLPDLVPTPSLACRSAGQALDALEQRRQKEEIANDQQRAHRLITRQRFALYRFCYDNDIPRFLIYYLTKYSHEDKRTLLGRLTSHPSKLKRTVLKMPGLEKQRFSDFDDFFQWLRKAKTIEQFGTLKHSQRVIIHGKPSPTIMTIPDDLIHPREDRTLTVREMAALQGFENSFVFYGKATTGGPERKVQVPQYTQVGNAVPPPLARSIAKKLKQVNARVS